MKFRGRETAEVAEPAVDAIRGFTAALDRRTSWLYNADSPKETREVPDEKPG
jgi:hypothetical protein